MALTDEQRRFWETRIDRHRERRDIGCTQTRFEVLDIAIADHLAEVEAALASERAAREKAEAEVLSLRRYISELGERFDIS